MQPFFVQTIQHVHVLSLSSWSVYHASFTLKVPELGVLLYLYIFLHIFCMGFFSILFTTRSRKMLLNCKCNTGFFKCCNYTALYSKYEFIIENSSNQKNNYTVSLQCSSSKLKQSDKIVVSIFTKYVFDVIQYHIGLPCRRLIWPLIRDICHLIFVSFAFYIQHIYHRIISPRHN